jgi:hypothetical protein
LVTKRGKVVAVLSPPEVREAEAAGLHGFMKGSVILPPGAVLLDTCATIYIANGAALRGGAREISLLSRPGWLAISFLPGSLHGDPADRLLIATARDVGIPLVTSD